MRVLIITWEFPPYVVGGLGKHVAELVPQLGGLPSDDGELTVDILTTRYAGGDAVEVLNPFTTIYRVDTPPIDLLDLYNNVVVNNEPLIAAGRHLFEQEPYDLIHNHDWLTGEASIVLKHEWKVPLVNTIHATERGRHQGNLPDFRNYQIDRMEWRTCFEAWRAIVCSTYMVTELHSYFGTPLDKIEIIPNGVNPKELKRCSQSDIREMRQLYAPNGERLLFFVGRIVYEKGLQVLLQAMPIILDKYPNTRLLIAGKNSQEMLPIAQRLGIESATSFLGFISDAERDCIYQFADAAVFPSLYEPFGIVALEAMALNCNVIASDTGGLGEVVKHMQTGLTSFPDNPESIAWAVDQLFRYPQHAGQRRRWAAYQVRTQYNWNRIAERTAQVYSEIHSERLETNW
jgi:glycogen(starch) synthase